jgi:hypothetical protein
MPGGTPTRPTPIVRPTSSTMRVLSIALLLLSSASAIAQVPAAPVCREWTECRRLAEAVAEAGDYEAFHDLAWRAVQSGPERHPELMYLLARAQSLSGRPHDALVMLGRLAGLGVATDASTSDDFRRVRALAGWADVAMRLGALHQATADVVEEAALETRAAAIPAATPAAASAVRVEVEEAVRFPAHRFTPGALAYDAVSRRFLVANPQGRRLMAVGEGSSEPVVMVRAESGGFEEVRAIEIDTRRGDLWMASGGAASGSSGSLHRFQLISGRSLEVHEPAAADRPVDLADIAVSQGGAVIALDRAGRRLFATQPGSRTLVQKQALDLVEPRSVAPAGDERVVYVAHDAGVARVLSAGRMLAPLAGNIDLLGFESIRWHRGSIVGVQGRPDGTRRLVRVRLDRSGETAIALDVLDALMPPGSGATLAGDDFYYLVRDAADVVIRRVRLK